MSQIRFGRGDITLVKAYAGSGKTSTLRLLSEANPGFRIRYLVFNKAMADEAAKTFPQNVECRTSHSIAYQAYGKPYERRLGPIRAKDISSEMGFDIHTSVIVVDALAHWFHSADREISNGHVDTDGDDKSEIAEAARETWDVMLGEGASLPMPHDGYQKLWSLSKPYCADFDLLMIDESQDLNPVVLDYAFRSAHQHGVPVVFVGDPHQSIYSWRGAVDAVSQVESRATRTCRLTHSFRFGPKIAAYASSILNRLKDDSVSIVGAGQGVSSDGHLCILGRTNFSLIDRALEELSSDPEICLHFSATNKLEKWNPRVPYRFQDLLDVLSIRNDEFDQVRGTYFRKFNSWKEILDFAEAGDTELKYLTRIVDEHESRLLEIASI